VLKLSKLQKWILRAALAPELGMANRQKFIHENEGSRSERPDVEWDPGRWGILFYADVKATYFKLPRVHDTKSWIFAKGRTPGYSAASNSVSRAAWRLGERGLIENFIYGRSVIAPTSEGYAIAASLEMKTPGAFGFRPIPRDYLQRIIREFKRIPAEERQALNDGMPVLRMKGV
jgi:hypothetical protein